ncbi:MAG: hypothetical protein PVJ67_02915 [Candidatus Pacearchaeota archaeon]|jgi:hypothetical protein
MGDNYARKCWECAYIGYSAKNDSRGLCDRLEDPSYVFRVSLDNCKCLYDNPGSRISFEEIVERQEKARIDNEKFFNDLRRASEKAAKMPKWKREEGRRLFGRF